MLVEINDEAYLNVNEITFEYQPFNGKSYWIIIDGIYIEYIPTRDTIRILK